MHGFDSLVKSARAREVREGDFSWGCLIIVPSHTVQAALSPELTRQSIALARAPVERIA